MATQAITKIDPQEIQRLETAKTRAETIVVKDKIAYIEISQILGDARARIKEIERRWEPSIEIKRQELNDLRNEMAKELVLPKAIEEVSSTKAADWKREERRLTQLETDQKNAAIRAEAERKAAEERRAAEAEALRLRQEREAEAERVRKETEKELARQQREGEIGKREQERLKKEAIALAEKLKKEAAETAERQREQAARQEQEARNNVQTVRVQPAVPKVAGVRARVNPKWRMLDIGKVPREYLYPNDIAATENFPRITVEVRKSREGESFQQRKARLEALIPGIEYFEQDAV